MNRFSFEKQGQYRSIGLPLVYRSEATITKLIKPVPFIHRISCTQLLIELINNVRDWLEVCVDATRLTYLTGDDGTALWW
jgi:hypothetical protein